MKGFRLIVAFAALLGTAAAQRHKLVINAETPEGQLLQQIGQEADAAKKLALMEDFVQKYPRHDGTGWVLEQMVSAYLKSNAFDKAIAAGQKLLEIDPEDVATAHNVLKAAEGKKDPVAVKEWAGKTSQIARKVAAKPKPQDEDEQESWKATVDYAKQVDTYTEYSMYAAGLQSADPAQRIALYEAIEAQNPQSQYLAQMRGIYFLALRQAGQNDKALAFAEKVVETDQSNEDMLLVVADSYHNKKQNPEKVIALSQKLVELMQSKAKPEGVSDEDWAKRKTLLTGLGWWMTGITYGNQNKFAECDQALRQALPLVKDNEALSAQALFYLGLANYRLGEKTKDKKRLAEALQFSRQCAKIKSPFQKQAANNARVIQQQYGLP